MIHHISKGYGPLREEDEKVATDVIVILNPFTNEHAYTITSQLNGFVVARPDGSAQKYFPYESEPEDFE